MKNEAIDLAGVDEIKCFADRVHFVRFISAVSEPADDVAPKALRGNHDANLIGIASVLPTRSPR